MVNAIWAEMGLRYPPKVEPLPKQTTHTVGSADGLSIFLGERTPSWCLLHELAHDMTSTDETSDGHSSQFMGVYLKLLARYLRMNLLELAKSAAEDGLAVDVEADPPLCGHETLANLHKKPIYCKYRSNLMLQPRERTLPPPQIDPSAAFRGFFAIADAWALSAEDAKALLGAPAERTFYAWRAGNAVRVPMDTLRRIGYVAGIFKALELIYSDPHLADGWIKCTNNAFGGQTPLQRMRAGDVTDLAAVRAYLDTARAPWS